MLFAVYALCMYALYSFMPVVVKMTSATAVNLSLLTADLFSLFCGLFLFNYKVSPAARFPLCSSFRGGVSSSAPFLLSWLFRPQFSALYIISFVVITTGFILFNAFPTNSSPPENPAESDDRAAANPSLRPLPSGIDVGATEAFDAATAL